MKLGLTAFFLGSVPALAATAPDLGSTSPYAIVSSTFTNTTAGTSITGDVCYTTPPAVAPAVTGAIAVPCPAQTGTDQNTARNDLISQDCTSIGAAVALNEISIGGGTLGEFPPGCYSSTGAMSITTSTTVTLTGTGVHIFRPGGALDPAANSNIVMAGGACEDNVFWAPVGATTIGANSNFIGNIFRGTADGLSITFGDTSTLVGRALAYGSTVTTANTTITVPAPCLVPATITVNKNFIPNSISTVPVALSCTSGTVTTTPLNASESNPAVFTVTGASQGATCSATETVPVGYTANQTDCVNVPLDGSCTITNTLNTAQFTVIKDFIPNSIATVPVALSCTSGNVTTTPLNASESNPAVFTVTGAIPGATCTATETVPVGYTGNQANCVGVALGGSCTITNTLNSNTIVVNKDFSPNSTATVPVALSCTSGNVTTTPLNASESTPAVFTVTGANPGATCTATETVPNGYTADQSDCVGVTLGGSCMIINTLDDLPDRATFRVIKDFTDGNPMFVEVNLSCNTGLILDQNKNISESQDVEFVVTSYDQGELNCAVTETLLPGYTPDYTASAPTGVGLFSSDLQGCHFDEVVSGQFVCVITNSPDLVDIEIEKLWVIDSDNEDGVNKNYKLSLYCDDPIGLVNVFHGDDSGTFISEVEPQYPSTHCWVIETVYSSAVEIDNQCQNLEISAALGGDSCLITNTVFFESIPTLDRYGLLMLILLVLGVGVVGFRRFY